MLVSNHLIFLMIGYLLGSVPFGLLLSKVGGYGDIRKTGSGNIGATNVLRTGNKKLAAATLLLDMGKGALACIIALQLAGNTTALFAGFGALMGHMFPLWLKFKGGKGVATALGILLATAPLAGIAACITWLVTFFFSRISSLSALVAMAATPIVSYIIYGNISLSAFCLLMSAIIWIKHKDNIKRLASGTEPKVGSKNTQTKTQAKTK